MRILYRNEATVPASFRNRVELVKGDVTNTADVLCTLKGTDAVVVTLGTRHQWNATNALSTGLQHIVNAMKSQNLQKISICLSAFLIQDSANIPKKFRKISDEQKAMLAIMKSSGLDFIVGLPMHHDATEPSNKRRILCRHRAPARLMAKMDLAKFLVEVLERPKHYGQICGIAMRQRQRMASWNADADDRHDASKSSKSDLSIFQLILSSLCRAK